MDAFICIVAIIIRMIEPKCAHQTVSRFRPNAPRKRNYLIRNGISYAGPMAWALISLDDACSWVVLIHAVAYHASSRTLGVSIDAEASIIIIAGNSACASCIFTGVRAAVREATR